jgi:hypothetical protein
MLMRIINIYNIILHLRRCLRSGACSATATLSQTAVLSASMSDRLQGVHHRPLITYAVSLDKTFG